MADDADQTITDPAAPGAAPLPNGEDVGPQIGFLTQYVKDLSVENPNSPQSFSWTSQPEVDIQVNISANPVDTEITEVALKMTVTARAPEGIAYAVELVYCGLIGMRNVSEEQAHPFLFAEAPRVLFPFARRVLADAVRDAGFAPLVLDMIDFGALYVQQRSASAESLAAQTPLGQA